MDNGLLITLICVLGGGFVVILNEMNKKKSSKAKEMLESGSVVIDVRTPEEFNSGHRTYDLQSETFTALNGLLEKRSQIIESLQQKAVDIESAYDHEKNVLISRIDSLSSRVKELEASSLSQNTQIKALRDNLSREKDRAILAIRQLHCVQEELEEYFSLSSVQSAALDSSLSLQDKYSAFIFDHFN